MYTRRKNTSNLKLRAHSWNGSFAYRGGLRRRRRRHKPMAALKALFKKVSFFDIIMKKNWNIYKKK